MILVLCMLEKECGSKQFQGLYGGGEGGFMSLLYFLVNFNDST